MGDEMSKPVAPSTETAKHRHLRFNEILIEIKSAANQIERTSSTSWLNKDEVERIVINGNKILDLTAEYKRLLA